MKYYKIDYKGIFKEENKVLGQANGEFVPNGRFYFDRIGAQHNIQIKRIMIELNLQKKRDEYQKKGLDFFEEMCALDAIIKINEWDNMSDREKIDERKKKYDYYDYHFHISLDKKYEQSIINLSFSIINFLTTYPLKGSNYIDRLFVLLYCEIKLINKNISYKNINHIPYEIFEPLIEKVKDKEEYKLYKLDELFKEYKEMYDLFLENPYKNA